MSGTTREAKADGKPEASRPSEPDQSATEIAAQAELRRRFLATLERTQWLPPDQMTAYQHRLLEPLLRHAAAEVPFYRDGRLTPVLRPGGGLDMNRWHEVPILTREEARQAGTRLHAEHVPEVMGVSRTDSTSGSTGTPLRLLQSGVMSLASQCCGLRHMAAHGFDETSHVAHMENSESWPSEAAKATQIGRHSYLDIARPEQPPLEWLHNIAATHLVTLPSFARSLARDAASGRAPAPPRLIGVVLYGEPVSAETRAEIEAAFAAPVIERYAAEEVGMIAGGCNIGALHLQPELNLVEILTGDGSPSALGTEGDVVVTSLYNYHMPFIRYALGDRATLSAAACRCGRQAPVLAGIAGRMRDVFIRPDGSRIWPVISFAKLSQLLPTRQFQIVQTARDAVTVRYVPDIGSVDREAVTALIRERLWQDLRVTLEPVDVIPRESSGKYRDYICLVEV